MKPSAKVGEVGFLQRSDPGCGLSKCKDNTVFRRFRGGRLGPGAENHLQIDAETKAFFSTIAA